jgi:hypothetical protein
VTRIVPILAAALLIVSCGAQPEQVDRQAEWRDVLERKKAAVSAEATPKNKQVYADSVAAFVRRHPDHGRARDVYHRIQVEFAQELGSLGRHQDAIRFYRSVLQRDPRNEDALRGLADAVDRLAVSREKLLRLEKGMSHRDVSQILGKPIPGWTVKQKRRNGTYEGWYYRTVSGSVAGVYFRDGKVFAAEESSDAKVGL